MERFYSIIKLIAGYVAAMLICFIPGYLVYIEEGIIGYNRVTSGLAFIIMFESAVEMAKLYDPRLKKSFVEILIWAVIYLGVIFYFRNDMDVKTTALYLNATFMVVYLRCYYIIFKHKSLLDEII